MAAPVTCPVMSHNHVFRTLGNEAVIICLIVLYVGVNMACNLSYPIEQQVNKWTFLIPWKGLEFLILPKPFAK